MRDTSILTRVITICQTYEYGQPEMGRQDMNDDLNSSLDYLWEMLTDKGLYMEANIVALAQNRIEELEARVYIHVSAMRHPNDTDYCNLQRCNG
jgi:5'(3')-deoxyribonucleotidase